MHMYTQAHQEATRLSIDGLLIEAYDRRKSGRTLCITINPRHWNIYCHMIIPGILSRIYWQLRPRSPNGCRWDNSKIMFTDHEKIYSAVSISIHPSYDYTGLVIHIISYNICIWFCSAFYTYEILLGDSRDTFIHLFQGCFIRTSSNVRLRKHTKTRTMYMIPMLYCIYVGCKCWMSCANGACFIIIDQLNRLADYNMKNNYSNFTAASYDMSFPKSFS